MKPDKSIKNSLRFILSMPGLGFRLPNDAIKFNGSWYLRIPYMDGCPYGYCYVELLEKKSGLFVYGEKSARNFALEKLDDRYKHLHKCSENLTVITWSPKEDDDPHITACQICDKEFGWEDVDDSWKEKYL